MKSSVRILAIALALAFLLLARTAYQDDTPVSAAVHIDIDDGEAAFADFASNGRKEAKYVGLGESRYFHRRWYFYVE